MIIFRLVSNIYSKLKVVVRAENLPRVFLQTRRNYYFLFTKSKIQGLKKFHRFVENLML